MPTGRKMGRVMDGYKRKGELKADRTFSLFDDTVLKSKKGAVFKDLIEKNDLIRVFKHPALQDGPSMPSLSVHTHTPSHTLHVLS